MPFFVLNLRAVPLNIMYDLMGAPNGTILDKGIMIKFDQLTQTYPNVFVYWLDTQYLSEENVKVLLKTVGPNGHFQQLDIEPTLTPYSNEWLWDNSYLEAQFLRKIGQTLI
jgi:hypothetical protein